MLPLAWLAVSCDGAPGGEWQPPERSGGVIVRAQLGLQLCAGTARHMDQTRREALARLQPDADPDAHPTQRLYITDDKYRIAQHCRTIANGCASAHFDYAIGKWSSMRHEIVHLVDPHPGGPDLTVEGFARLFGNDLGRGGLQADYEELLTNESEDSTQPAAAGFVWRASERYGMDSVVAFHQRLNGNMSWQEFEKAFEEHFGESIDPLMTELKELKDQLLDTRAASACWGYAPTLDYREDGQYEVPIDCAKNALGTEEEPWVDRVIELPAGTFRVSVEGASGGSLWRCANRIGEEPEEISLRPSSSPSRSRLKGGRYKLTVRGDKPELLARVHIQEVDFLAECKSTSAHTEPLQLEIGDTFPIDATSGVQTIPIMVTEPGLLVPPLTLGSGNPSGLALCDETCFDCEQSRLGGLAIGAPGTYWLQVPAEFTTELTFVLE